MKMTTVYGSNFPILKAARHRAIHSRNEFPDLEGCQTQGDTQQELLANAAEALEGYALCLLENGQKLPSASNPTKIRLEDENSFISLIQTNVDLSKHTKSVKKTLTIPAWLNERALAEKINFSSVLQNALLKELKIG